MEQPEQEEIGQSNKRPVKPLLIVGTVMILLAVSLIVIPLVVSRKQQSSSNNHNKSIPAVENHDGLHNASPTTVNNNNSSQIDDNHVNPAVLISRQQVEFGLTVAAAEADTPSNAEHAKETSANIIILLGLEQAWSSFCRDYFERHPLSGGISDGSPLDATVGTRGGQRHLMNIMMLVEYIYIPESAKILRFYPDSLQAEEDMDFMSYHVEAEYQYQQITTNNTNDASFASPTNLSSSSDMNNNYMMEPSSMMYTLLTNGTFEAILQEQIPAIPVLFISPPPSVVVENLNPNNNNTNNNHNNTISSSSSTDTATDNDPDRYACDELLAANEISVVEIPYHYEIRFSTTTPIIKEDEDDYQQIIDAAAKDLSANLLAAVASHVGLQDGRVCSIPPITTPWLIELATIIPSSTLLYDNDCMVLADVNNAPAAKCSWHRAKLQASILGDSENNALAFLHDYLQQNFDIVDGTSTTHNNSMGDNGEAPPPVTAAGHYQAAFFFHPIPEVPLSPSQDTASMPSLQPTTGISSSSNNNNNIFDHLIGGGKEDDPWEGVTMEETETWQRGDNGLNLTVIHALQSHWDDIFDLVVQDWDNGTPNILDLSIERQDPDKDCEPVDAVVKVCNGDYGATGWRGIQQVILRNGFIVASMTKLNEFYLANTSDDERRYVLCHHLGHAWGLPHVEEDYFNTESGTCMSYTRNPTKNISPNTADFERLAQLSNYDTTTTNEFVPSGRTLSTATDFDDEW